LKAADSSRRFKVLGVVKEVASEDSDDYFGLDAFRKHFPHEIYLDEGKSFYSLLGKGVFRSVGLGSFMPWKLPGLIKSYIGHQELGGSHTRGEGAIQGGVMVVGPAGQGIIYEHQEVMGQNPEEFIREVEEAILKMHPTDTPEDTTSSRLHVRS